MEATGKDYCRPSFLAVIKTLMKHPYINASLTEDAWRLLSLHNYSILPWQLGWIMDWYFLYFFFEKMSLSELVVAFKIFISAPWMINWLQVGYKFNIPQSVIWGMFGVRSFGPVINQLTQLSLVSVRQWKPVVVNGEIVVP